MTTKTEDVLPEPDIDALNEELRQRLDEIVDSDVTWENVLHHNLKYYHKEHTEAARKIMKRICTSIQFESTCNELGVGVPDGWISNLKEIIGLSLMRDDRYQKLKSLKQEKMALHGKKNKKKRCKMNKRILMCKVELAHTVMVLQKFLMSQEYEKGSDAYRMLKESKRERMYESVRFCDYCESKMFDWKGCPCKKAWYCDRECQKRHRKIHKKVCTC